MKNLLVSSPSSSLLLILLLLLLFHGSIANRDGLSGRHSFSLSTFDPSGKLEQVEFAMKAASMGTPIVAFTYNNSNNNNNNNNNNFDDSNTMTSKNNDTSTTTSSSDNNNNANSVDCGIVMAAPQAFLNPFMVDDGTPRFVPISPQIFMAHSGIAGDGRVVSAAAQQLAIEHAYTYNEPISIELFLQQISLLLQEYTMKPGTRPFGIVLLVGYVPTAATNSNNNNDNDNNNNNDDGNIDNNDVLLPQLYRIDASGTVQKIQENKGTVINATTKPLRELQNKLETVESSGEMRKLLQKALEDSDPSFRRQRKNTNSPMRWNILTASLTRNDGFQVYRTLLEEE